MENNEVSSDTSFKSIAFTISPALAYLFLQWVWKMGYVRDQMPGIYWLFVAADYVFPISIAVTFALAIILLIFAFVYKRRTKKSVFLPAISLFLFCTSIICSLPMHFAQSTIHMQSIRAGGRVYYLAAYPMFDVNFAIAECDPLGVFCKTVYRSGDIMDSNWDKATLKYQESERILQLHEPEEGVIFTYPVP